MKSLLLDLDGVIYQQGRLIPGASEAVAWLRHRRIPFLFLTNTTSRPRATVVAKLAGFGIEVAPEEIFTPAVAACSWLTREIEGRVALFVPEATREDFSELSLLPEGVTDGAAAVVLGDLGMEWDFSRLNRAFRLLAADPATILVGLGRTRYWRGPDGLRLDTGPFVAALEYASDRRAVILGKPATPFYQAALAELGKTAGETVMVGDDLRGDVGGAFDAGMKAVLVKTGKFRPDDLDQEIKPSAVLSSIADLPRWWQSQLSD